MISLGLVILCRITGSMCLWRTLSIIFVVFVEKLFCRLSIWSLIFCVCAMLFSNLRAWYIVFCVCFNVRRKVEDASVKTAGFPKVVNAAQTQFLSLCDLGGGPGGG